MDYFQSIFKQLKAFWAEASHSSKFGIIAVTLLCIGTIVGVGYWSAQPNYVPLTTNLPPDKASQVLAKLESEGVACKLNYSGSSVLVDQGKWSRARLLINEIVDPDQVTQNSTTSGFLLDPDSRKDARVQSLESRLSRTITMMDSVEKAVVHLGLAEDRPTVLNQKDSTASVVLTLKNGALFSLSHAAAIGDLVAHSVTGLKSENVKVLDDSGRLLSRNSANFEVGSTTLEIQRAVERERAQKAEAMLAFLGPGRAKVTVTAQIDLSSTKLRDEIINSENKAPTFEKTETSKTTTTSKNPPNLALSGSTGGLAGSAGNIDSPNNQQNSASNILESREVSEKKMENGKTIEESMQWAKLVTNLSVAAVVDLTPEPAEGSTETPPPLDIPLAEIEEIIKKAVGFDESRSDTIKVVVAEMPQDPLMSNLLALPLTPNSVEYLDILKNVSLGVASLVALFIGYLVLRKMRPITVTEKVETTLSPERAKHLADLSSIAKQNPEILSRIVAAWVNEPAPESSTEQTNDRAAA